MDENPYASPEAVTELDPAVEPDEDADELRPTLQTHRIHGRLCVLVVAVVCGLMAAVSAYSFWIGLAYRYPGTMQSVWDVEPVWLASRGLYAVGFGGLAWRLVRYQAAIKRWDSPETVGNDEFLAIHTGLWKWAAAVLLAFVVYTTVYMVVAARGI